MKRCYKETKSTNKYSCRLQYGQSHHTSIKFSQLAGNMKIKEIIGVKEKKMQNLTKIKRAKIFFLVLKA